MKVRGFGQSARQWQRQIAEPFLDWRRTSGSRSAHFQSVCDGVLTAATVLSRSVGPSDSGDLARALPRALSGCDDLDFSDLASGIAYLILHFADRYGRTDQVLESLLRLGYAPIRRNRVMILDVGSGPASSSYAALDFFGDLTSWGANVENEYHTGAAKVHLLDRGEAWGFIVHQLSERLVQNRGLLPNRDNIDLPFRRRYVDFTGFSVRAEHHRHRKLLMEEVVRDQEGADERSDRTIAWQQAYEAIPQIPSAYDLIFVSNFLTSTSFTDSFKGELMRLARSLTPGGVLLFLTATGHRYSHVHDRIREIARRARLRPIRGFEQPIEANPDLEARNVIANQVRKGVELARESSGLSQVDWYVIAQELPTDILDDTVRFYLPKFRVFAYRRAQGPARSRHRGRSG